METRRVRKRYWCTLFGSEHPVLVEGDYEVMVCDDNHTFERLVYGSLRVVTPEEGHA